MFFTAAPAELWGALHYKNNKHNSLLSLHCFPISLAPITCLFHSQSSTFFSFTLTSHPLLPSRFFPTSCYHLPLFSPFYHFCTLYLNLFLLLFRVWEVTTGEVLNTLIHHNEAVLHLRFANGLMVTCSKDRSIAVWDMASPTDISLRRVLVGHRAAVNVVDFDDKYIVSASGDRTIKVATR